MGTPVTEKMIIQLMEREPGWEALFKYGYDAPIQRESILGWALVQDADGRRDVLAIMLDESHTRVVFAEDEEGFLRYAPPVSSRRSAAQ